MRNFAYQLAASPAEAVAAAAAGDTLLAGGTDLITLMKAALAAPERVTDISRVAEWQGIRPADGGLWIGSGTTLAEVAAHPAVRRDYTALAEAAESSATPQLRHMATIGGNLLQQPRCWYYRSGFHCWLAGGSGCPAAAGANQYHAVFFPPGEGPGQPDGAGCVAVHPSDPAVALAALDARVELVGPAGSRTVPLLELFQRPEPDRRSLTALRPGEVIAAIRLPAPTGRSTYLKAMARKTWSFALAAVAVHLEQDAAGVVRAARVVLGGVARLPWRAVAAEAAVVGRPLDEAVAAAAAGQAVAGAAPLSRNGYKVDLVQALVRRGLLTAAGRSGAEAGRPG